MEELYYGSLVLFVLLFAVKAALTIIYWRKKRLPGEEPFTSSSEKNSVVQPILSGDPTLAQNLTENLRNLPHAKFIWLIDKSDGEAQVIVRNIMDEYPEASARVQVMEIDDPPANLNPKVYKLVQAMPYVEKYTVVLDDDTVLGRGSLAQAISKLTEESLVTGIPMYINPQGVFSKLVSAFVNASALFTYLPMALLAKPKTINGMYYITSTALLKRIDAFGQIVDKLCDDYEIAKLCKEYKISIVQSVTPCMIRTTVTGATHYKRLMKRWMVFANRFLKENLSFLVLFIVVLPSFMPIVMLILALKLGAKFVMLFLLIHFLKSLSYSYIRKILLGKNEGVMMPCYEMAAEYLQVFHFVHSILFANEIQWRSRTIKLEKDKVVL